MAGRYLRVQEAAALLGVSPVTIRWYSRQGWLPTYRVGRGQVAHRRFRYADIEAVARRTGRFLAAEPRWETTVPVTLDMAAYYLGLSARYLIETGAATTGARMTWEDLIDLEHQIYGTTPAVADPTQHVQEKEDKPMRMMMERCGSGPHGTEGDRPMGPMMRERCGCGPRGRGGPGREEKGAGWPEADRPRDDASLLMLRRAQRHLETQRADLEDQIAEIAERIRLHPDNHDASS